MHSTLPKITYILPAFYPIIFLTSRFSLVLWYLFTTSASGRYNGGNTLDRQLAKEVSRETRSSLYGMMGEKGHTVYSRCRSR